MSGYLFSLIRDNGKIKSASLDMLEADSPADALRAKFERLGYAESASGKGLRIKNILGIKEFFIVSSGEISGIDKTALARTAEGTWKAEYYIGNPHFIDDADSKPRPPAHT